MELDGVMLNVISAYAQLVGCIREEKKAFWLVIVNESVAKQHRIVLSAIIVWTKWRKAPKPVKRIKWWKLKDFKVKNKFKMEVIKSGILGGKEDCQRVAEMIRSIDRMELGETSGKIGTAGRRETWWWNQEVHEKLKDKRNAKKAWDTIKNDASNLAYKTARKQAKREVAKARNKAYGNCTRNWRQRRKKMSCLR